LISTVNWDKGIVKYKFLAFIYAIAVLSFSIANSAALDVQKFYRIPFTDIRWIDLAILLVIASFFLNLTYRIQWKSKVNMIVPLCFLYLIFETFQLIRSWGLNDPASQISHFICTCSLFIVIDLSTYALPIEKIVSFLKKLTIWGAVVLTVSNLYLIYAFMKGNIVYEDLDIRVALEVFGSKETVYASVLVSLVYAVGLYLLHQPGKLWERIVIIVAIMSIYGTLVIEFKRGSLVTILFITIYSFVSSGKLRKMLPRIFGLGTILVICYLIFGGMLSERGYSPLEKLAEMAKFSTDVDNPDWDKGRSVSQEYAIAAWKKQIWFGAGYDELFHYELPEDVATAHNGVLTSLFHRGIIGTTILMLIFILLYKNAINLWSIIKKKTGYHNDMIKLLIFVSFFWIIPFMTQEALWEKYSLTIQFLYLGLISNIYKQQTNL
jgi:O-Antigen ligase